MAKLSTGQPNTEVMIIDSLFHRTVLNKIKKGVCVCGGGGVEEILNA